jgi:hypothetical protein
MNSRWLKATRFPAGLENFLLEQIASELQTGKYYKPTSAEGRAGGEDVNSP